MTTDSKLTLEANLEDPDAFYAYLLAAHDGLDPAESEALNARLIFVLANHIGSQDILRDAIDKAVAAKGG